MKSKQLYLPVVFVLLVSALILTGCSDSTPTTAKQGVLDATDWNFNEHEITLNGEWEFYWNKLLQPQDFSDSLTKHYMHLPGVWNNSQLEGVSLQGEGYATFRIKIKTHLKNKKLGLRIPFHFTAYRLWINQELLAENGVVGTTKNASTPQTLPTYIYFEVPDDDILITLQVSNFHFYKGGAPAPYSFGLEKLIKKNQTQQFATDLFLTGSLFIMAFYHLGLFLLRKKEISNLYFCIVCFLIMLRTICLSETFLIILYPDFNFELYIKFVFISLFIGPSFFVLFLEKLFPQEAKPILGKIFLGVCILFSLSLLFPAYVSSLASVPFMLVLGSTLIYELYILIKASVNKRSGAFLALLGMFILVVTSLNDILFDSQIIKTDYYTSYGLFVFIFIQSFLLSMKFSNAFSSVESLSVHIKEINKANSRFVPSEFLSFLGKESIVDVKLGDHIIKDMTIFFVDIRSFTTLSESMTPEENFNFINSLLKRISPIVRNNNGFIDKFMGDSIMALFPGHPKDALATASQVLQELEHYNANRFKANLLPIQVGIGINEGTLMLGTIGEEERMEGTVISDSVNLASRLEGLTKIYGANVIVGESVLMKAKDLMPLEYRFLGNVNVKGKSDTVSIYDIYSFDAPETKKRKQQTKEQLEEAIRLFQEGSIQEAKEVLQTILKIFPDDKAARYYLDTIVKELK